VTAAVDTIAYQERQPTGQLMILWAIFVLSDFTVLLPHFRHCYAPKARMQMLWVKVNARFAQRVLIVMAWSQTAIKHVPKVRIALQERMPTYPNVRLVLLAMSRACQQLLIAPFVLLDHTATKLV
jgi:hypothetical protein